MGIVSAANPVGEGLGGRYRVLRRLGTGGMGTVYLAEHVLLGRLCAVKVLCPPLCDDDPSVEQRFRQEALLVASVRHPGIAQVYASDRGPDARFLLAMEYAEGQTAAQRLRPAGPCPLPAGAWAAPDPRARCGGGGRGAPPSRPGGAGAVGGGVRAGGGAGVGS